MKGRLAVRTIVLLLIAVIVIAIAIYFLVYVTNFDTLFLSNDQRILKQYATCALAYCADGTGSNQVNGVGCLKSEGGKCVLSCAQVEEEIYKKNNVPYQPLDRKYYCGKEAALEFEFSGISLGGTVPLTSGQMYKIATGPQWICGLSKFPFTNIYIDSVLPTLGLITTSDLQYSFGKNCIILDRYAAIIPISIFAPSGFVSGGACFTGIFYDEKIGRESQIYTPIIEYESDVQKKHPSAIYLSESDGFASILPGNEEPECILKGQKNEFKQLSIDELSEDFKKKNPRVLKPGTQRCRPPCVPETVEFNKLTRDQQEDYVKEIIKTGQELSSVTEPSKIEKCNFKTTYQGKKIKYKVWAEPTLPPWSLLGTRDFLDAQITGSCTSVTLSRDLKGTSITPEDIAKEAEKLQFSDPTAVGGIATANSETSPFALIDGQKTYLFFERTTGDAFEPLDVSSKEIWYTISEDGGSTWQEAKRITDYSTGVSASEPSAAVFGGEIYVAYKERTGQRRENAKYNVVVKSLDGTYEKKFADIEKNDRGGPSLVVFDNKLYLFYHQQAGTLASGNFYNIYYTTWDGNRNNDWQFLTFVPTPKIDGVEKFLNAPNTWSMYPSAIATSNGVVLSYSYSASGGVGPFHEAFDVRAVRFDGKGTSEDLGEISVDESGTDIPNRRQGFSHLVEKNGEIFVFYDEDDIARGGKTVDPTEAEFKSHINYKKYNSGSGWDVFPTSLFETKSKALQPTPVAVDDKILLFFSSNEGSSRWDILSSAGEKKIVLTEVPSGPDIVQSISGKTDKDSYKKGETIKFAGSLTMSSGKPEGKEVRIVLKFGPTELLNQDAAVAADGSFVWEYALPAGVSIGTYEIVASSGGKEVSYKFAVTG